MPGAIRPELDGTVRRSARFETTVPLTDEETLDALREAGDTRYRAPDA